MVEIEFGNRDAATRIRNDSQFKGFLSEGDDARSSTVVLKEGTPSPAVTEIQGEASETRAHKAEQYGQAELTRTEKKRLDFTETNVMRARSVKALALGKGVSNWMDYYDPKATVDDHRDIMQSAVRDSRDRRVGRGLDDERELDRRLASASHTIKDEEVGRAKTFAFEGDEGAREFVTDQGRRSEVFDISYERRNGRLFGSGEDYERLQEHHDSRSKRAQTLDEKKNAPVTRDPFEWQDNPGKYDYPGIDTVEPQRLHDERSPQAQARDERNAAPLTDDREKWAMNPGRFDFAGVDDVDPEKLHASRSARARKQDEGELAPIADNKQQWAMNPGRFDWPGVDTPNQNGNGNGSGSDDPFDMDFPDMGTSSRGQENNDPFDVDLPDMGMSNQKRENKDPFDVDLF